MKFFYTAQQLSSGQTAQQTTFLLTNGLGGYVSMSGAFGAPRCDQGILVAAAKAPNVRIDLVHRLAESLRLGDEAFCLSGQTFADGQPAEQGLTYLRSFSMEYVPQWEYEVAGVRVVRRCAMAQGENTAAVLYEICNSTEKPCTLALTPYFKFAPKEDALQQGKALSLSGSWVCGDTYKVNITTDGQLQAARETWQLLAYPEDAKDGRPDRGLAGTCCKIEKTVLPGEKTSLEVVFSTGEQAASGWEILKNAQERLENIAAACDFADPVAKHLAVSADAYIARRDSTDGKTILAGYPLFSDWGRDTMIALPGCCLATGRYEDAKSILRTFLAYEKDGLVPNLFPEGDQAPMYNTVDAALLLIDSVWQYVQRTGDWDFVKEAWPVMEHIVACYRGGTHHGIGMDTDGLIFAGQGLDQVTWMDVCVQGILPTPRHGKPVEINAYWYNALMIMGEFARKLGCCPEDYLVLAQKVKSSFVEKFYIPEKGYLRDVLSGTDADEQIRCNQIWALSMPFTMLEKTQQMQVFKTVQKHLHTPCGLRTLSPEDDQYHAHYGGPQLDRDLAYHQGTTWVFPMGAYYRAWLKVYDNTREAVLEVKEQLKHIEQMMRQGCAGQLPEIYDGENPYEGKGCFGQAWSVGEILRVYEVIDTLEKEQA